MKRTSAAFAAAFVALGWAFYAPAALITWEPPRNISGASDVSTEGTYFGSWAPYDGNANLYPVNGVTFQGYDDLGISQSGFNGGGPYFGPHTTADANYNTLLNYGAYSDGTAASFTLNGGGTRPLTVGQQYLIQFWVSDARNLGVTRSETISGSSPLSFPANGSGMGQFAIGRFTADATSQSLDLSATQTGGGGSAQINLLQVREVPEPGTMAALGFGLLGLAALRGRLRRRS